MSKASCPSCGSASATRRQLASYPYRESGLDNVVLSGGVEEFHCERCGERSVAVHLEPQLLQVLVLALLQKPTLLTGAEMRYLRKAVGLSQAELSERLRLRRETIAERELRATPNHRPADDLVLRLVVVAAFREHLSHPQNRHLAPGHVRELERIQRVLGEKVAALLRQFARSGAVGITARQLDRKGWRVELTPASAA